jgi:PhnB protein
MQQDWLRGSRRHSMGATLNPYISFGDNAREAMEFYKGVFGGTLTLNTFGDFGSTGPEADQVMHSQLETDAGFVLMASDTPPGMDRTVGNNISISLSGDDAALRRYWEELSASGSVTTPMEKMAWGDEFGTCVDRFGIVWLVNISQPA